MTFRRANQSAAVRAEASRAAHEVSVSFRLHQVDAFTDVPFAGNPAAVAILRVPVGEAFMQSVATEMNLSETAFVTPMSDGTFGLRWFTPAAEVDLCGHATLASAHVLWQEGVAAPNDRIQFYSLSGRLEVWRADGMIRMDFPSEAPDVVEPTAALARAVPAELVEVGRNRLDYMVVLSDEEQVRSLRPDMEAVAGLGSRGMIVTARSESTDYDFVSRYFAPQYGIPEDPVTGSAHCCLGPYWSDRLGKRDLAGYQASARGGTVYVAVRGDRVTLGGRAVTTAIIDLLIGSD